MYIEQEHPVGFPSVLFWSAQLARVKEIQLGSKTPLNIGGWFAMFG
jgi:hypothetical protein